ncbi:glycoside hydrolase 43 family protein [Paenibacillus filicis]|uniref:Glycoside hydrolase 43 family protein n=1 Tax=Paenibacillus gyeongsangnamensis TaxID=3388067 RepID=A0ABT4QAA1_9BACL|nr:glycoside hydrolase 43 family protein [Paenibacillus filicis]MCZ8513813.1 glycoside hydrolase 43 family protein [Paenibacillus filicis]
MNPTQSRLTPAWAADLGDGTYQNPVLYADYSDPDVIRVGDDFYMVSSSFSHLPGLPILHSKDLVNWSILGHLISTLELPGYDRPQHGKGVWAPSIRYHNGKFWVFFSTPDEGIFMSTAEDPAGEWTPLHMIKEVKGWIDPCPFWDEDGRAYLVHAFANSRCGIKHKLMLHRMSPDGEELLDDGVLVFDGMEGHPTMEGPKMYKRRGYYYIFAPAGGVSTGWQTILRSKTIAGPYEDRIVLHQGDSTVNGPHQGGWVELESGESWFIHFQDRDAFGRIVHLQPVRWEDDWPLMGEDTNGDGIGEPVLRYKKPKTSTEAAFAVPATSDTFEEAKLGLQWQWQANPRAEWFSLEERPGYLRLHTLPLPEGAATLYDAPQLLMQKLPAPSFSAVTRLEFEPKSGEEAGLIVFGDRYAFLAISGEEQGGYKLSLSIGEARDGDRVERTEESVRYNNGTVYLKVSVDERAECRFSYSLEGERYIPIGSPFRAAKGRWVGAKVGLFAADRNQTGPSGHADFNFFTVEKN